MCNTEFKTLTLNQLVQLLGDLTAQEKLRGSPPEKRAIVAPLIEANNLKYHLPEPDKNLAFAIGCETDPGRLIALWLGEGKPADAIYELLNRPIIEVEIVLSSTESFLQRITAYPFQSTTTMVIINKTSTAGKCPNCGTDLSLETNACPECKVPFMYFKHLPLVDGGLLRTSYTFLQEILKWDEVVAISSRQIYHSLDRIR